MKASFSKTGVELDLQIPEYEFLYMVLSHVLSGIKISDNDFRNILMMSREDGEKLMAQLGQMENEARFKGNHWIKGPVPSSATVQACLHAIYTYAPGVQFGTVP